MKEKEMKRKKKKFISYVNNHKIPIMTKNSTYWFEYGGKGVALFKFKNKKNSSNENDNSSKENTSLNGKEKE